VGRVPAVLRFRVHKSDLDDLKSNGEWPIPVIERTSVTER